MILQLFIVHHFANYCNEWLVTQLNRLPFQIAFCWCSQFHQHFYRVVGWRIGGIGCMGGWRQVSSHEVAGKSYVNIAKWHLLVPFQPPHTRMYHKKQLKNPWLNSSASCMVNYSWLSAYEGKRGPFKDHISTCGDLTNLSKSSQDTLSTNICLNCKLMCTAIF